MKTFCIFLREKHVPLMLTAASPVLFFAVFGLYGLELGPFLYALLVYALLWCTAWLCAYLRYAEAHRRRREAQNDPGLLPEPATLEEKDYAEMLAELSERLREITENSRAERTEAEEYYTLWVHQIKTPIAAMRLLLQGDSPENEALNAELFRVERYAEMALNYVRLGDSASDLHIRTCALDGIVRGVIRKYAPLMITKGLRLDYKGTDVQVLTDEKWLAFMLEQLLSNAVKYTRAGVIRIEVSADKVLTVRDTGTGISPEDLPRVFEKGFTGGNGRTDKRATGLGLYLCARTAHMLGVKLSAESVPGEGSAFSLYLDKPHVTAE